MQKESKFKPIIEKLEKGTTPSKNTYVLTEGFLLQNFSFRFNVYTQQVEGADKPNGKYRPVTDRLTNELIRIANKRGINTNKQVISNLINSNGVSPAYNPVTNYLENLPVWDGVTDHIAALANRIKVRDNPNWVEFFKKWFVAMISSSIDDNAHNEVMLILFGAQSIGKTTFLRSLIPEELNYLFYSGGINPTSDEFFAHLSKFLLINLDELVGNNKKFFRELKEFLSKKNIHFRIKYDRHGQDHVRRASFAGTTNESDFLFDLSGNRRFLSVEALEIDRSPFDISFAYAQAYQLYKSGFEYWFNNSDIQYLETENKKFLNISAEEELLNEIFEPSTKEDKDFLLTATEVAEVLFRKKMDSETVRRVGKLLKSKKFVRRKKATGNYAYCLKARSVDIMLEVGRFIDGFTVGTAGNQI